MPRRGGYARVEPAHGFWYERNSLQVSQAPIQGDELFQLVSEYLKDRFNAKQKKAFQASFTQRLSLLWGPPGTGKTTVLAGVILGWIEHAWRNSHPITIGVGASNYNAIDNVLREV